MKVNELKTLDGTRQRFLNYQQSVKEVQLQRLDDEIRRKVLTYILLHVYVNFHSRLSLTYVCRAFIIENFV